MQTSPQHYCSIMIATGSLSLSTPSLTSILLLYSSCLATKFTVGVVIVPTACDKNAQRLVKLDHVTLEPVTIVTASETNTTCVNRKHCLCTPDSISAQVVSSNCSSTLFSPSYFSNQFSLLQTTTCSFPNTTALSSCLTTIPFPTQLVPSRFSCGGQNATRKS